MIDVQEMERKTGLAIAAAVAVLAAVLAFGPPVHLLFQPTDTDAEDGLDAEDLEVEVVATDLEVPWEVVVLDEDRYLVSERTGDLLLMEDGEREVVRSFDDLEQPMLGEGGLLGVAVHPEFRENGYVYVYQTVDEEPAENVVRRFELRNTRLTNASTVVDGIPGARFHNGGRLEFGPDGYLYVTTGDATREELARRNTSLAGKILRVDGDGEVPPSNPFDDEIYSLGHRNPQGLAWDSEGRLWATEHGSSGRDELNLIQRGGDYGWPEYRGDEEGDGVTPPVVHSGADETWAPAGAAYHDGSVFYAGLRGERLFEARLDGAEVESVHAHLSDDFGRLRAVTLGPEERYLYVTTSNRDGRGDSEPDDDRLLRIPVENLG